MAGNCKAEFEAQSHAEGMFKVNGGSNVTLLEGLWGTTSKSLVFLCV